MAAGGPFRAQFDSAVAAASLQVTKENVLLFRDSIYREVERLQQSLRDHGQHAVRVPALGGDPVSGDAAGTFPVKIQGLLDQCAQYISDLNGAASALDHTARSYGLTEDDIANAFHASPISAPRQSGDMDRGRVALPSPSAAQPPPDGPRTQILAPGPGNITEALSPGTSGAV